ncbi:hypothetical protein LINPERPRIM_LOCUS29501 [Linum perenne]
MDIEEILSELYRTETRLQTQSKLDSVSLDTGATFSAQSIVGAALLPSLAPPTGAYAAYHPRPQFLSSGNVGSQSNYSEVKCRFCNELGHSLSYCRKRNLCTYCKKPGHIIPDYRLRKSRHGGDRGSSSGHLNARHGSHGQPAYGTYSGNSSATSIDDLVSAAIQRVLPSAITAAFSTVGLTGNSRPWFIDSGSSNHVFR